MNASPKISVIVPVYKVEPYLPQCIDSILVQTFADFELLLIDDGSPDRCGEICDEYARKDERVRVFHQKNAGVSVARNKGLAEARGEYVVFVDSDDYVLPEYIQDLYGEFPDGEKSGVVIETVVKLYPGELMKPCSLPHLNLSSKDKYRILTELADKNIGYPHSKLYCMDIIRRYQITFLPTVSLLEDLFFLLDYILQADFVLVRNVANYVYRVGHLTTALSMSDKPLAEEYRVFQNYYHRILHYQQEYGLPSTEFKRTFGELKIFFHRILLSLYTCGHFQKKSYKERKLFLKELVTIYPDWIQKEFAPDYLADRIARFLLSYRFYLCFDLWMRCLLTINFQYMFGTRNV